MSSTETTKYYCFDEPDEFVKNVQPGDLLWVNYPVVESGLKQELDLKIGVFENSNPKDKSKLIWSVPVGTAWALYVGEIKPAKNLHKSRAKVVVTTADGQLLLGWVQIIGLQKKGKVENAKKTK